MNWEKVAETLQIISRNHTKTSNDLTLNSGYHEAAMQHILIAEIYAGLSAAMRSGIEQKAGEK